MGNTATNVSTGKPKVTGAVYVAPKTATLPTNATSTLPSQYVCLGYVSEDGLENENELEVSDIKAWGGNIVYSSLTGMTDTFAFSLMESKNADVLKAVYGDANVSESGGAVTVNVKAETPEEKIWVFELALRGGIAKRIVVPSGAVTAREAITYNDSDAIGYGITVTAYPTANGTHQEFIEGEIEYEVTFNVDGGSSVAAQTVVEGGYAVQPASPTKEDYVFNGWYADAELTEIFNFSTTAITADTTIYAKWIAA